MTSRVSRGGSQGCIFDGKIYIYSNALRRLLVVALTSLRPSPLLPFALPPIRDLSVQRPCCLSKIKFSTGISFLFSHMALLDSKVLFWNGKVPSKSIHFDAVTDKDRTEQPAPAPTAVPSLCGMPLKYISYVFPLCLPLTHVPLCAEAIVGRLASNSNVLFLVWSPWQFRMLPFHCSCTTHAFRCPHRVHIPQHPQFLRQNSLRGSYHCLSH